MNILVNDMLEFPNNGDAVSMTLPEEFNETTTFYFTYTTEDGCVFTGTFGMIPTCVWPDDGFSFTVNHIGDLQESCGLNQEHSYTVNVAGVGNNFPYYIRVYMENAFDPSQSAFVQIEEYTGQDPFVISGIPAGSVVFESFNHCSDGNFSKVKHTNCCASSINNYCELIRTGYDGSFHNYHYPYFTISVKLECFDGNCNGTGNDDCSNIIVERNTTAPKYNCWTGIITIEYPDYENETVAPAVLEIVDQEFPINDQINWISGDDNWHPHSQGAYPIYITYTGTGDSEGDDCVQELAANFIGADPAIGFIDDWWFDFNGIPDEFYNAYYSAWVCNVCDPENAGGYIYNNDVESCAGFVDGTYYFFNLKPGDYSKPCNSGGTLTIMNYDDNGIPTSQEITLPVPADGETPNPSLLNRPALNGPAPNSGLICKSGWCLFDPTITELYGDAFTDDKPIVATWFNPDDCIVIPILDPDNPDSGCDDVENPCPEGYRCVEGDCLELCEDGDCFFGVCEEGVCVQDTGGGDTGGPITCQEGFELIDGEYVAEAQFCGFQGSPLEQGQGPQVFTIEHNQTGGLVTFRYRTLHIPDKITLSGSINAEIECVATETEWRELNFTVGAGNFITVRVSASDCTENGEAVAVSAYQFKFICEDGFQNWPSTSLTSTNTEGSNIAVHPNPFASNIDITASNVENPFVGQVLLLDYQGRQVINKEYTFEAGHNSINIDGLENLVKGVYIILIKKEGELYASRKVVKIE